MRNPIYKETYRGYGIYWHGVHIGYGDETKPLYCTIQEYKAAIDSHISQGQEARPAHLKYWDTLPHNDRQKWRKLCQTTELSAPELAYTNKLSSYS